MTVPVAGRGPRSIAIVPAVATVLRSTAITAVVTGPPFNRDDRSSGGQRPPFNRDDRGGRPFGGRDGGFRGEGDGSRTRYSRDERPSSRDEAPSREREELPPLAPDITAEELDKEIRDELRSLPLDLADLISRHLVAAERALGDGNAEEAYEHTKVARRFAARIGVIREAVGIAAYHSGHFAEALSDLRAARRMTGSDSFLPVMADCERGLGRPERALDLVRSKEAEHLDRLGKIELAIVESGARRDLGQKDAAVITLQRLPELRDTRPQPWSARLAFAYADALSEAGHEGPATEWFGRAMAFDEDGETDAAERYAELTGAVIEDLEEDEETRATRATSRRRRRAPRRRMTPMGVRMSMTRRTSTPTSTTLPFSTRRSKTMTSSMTMELRRRRSPSSTALRKTRLSTVEQKAEEKPERVEAGVGPAFIEPDFGDILSDPANIDDDLDDDDDDDDDEDERRRPEQGREEVVTRPSWVNEPFTQDGQPGPSTAGLDPASAGFRPRWTERR